MGRARVVVPPPEDFVPVPLDHTGHLDVPPAEEPVVEEVSETSIQISDTVEEVSTWVSGDMREAEDIPAEEYIDEEELERERIAQEKHEELLRQRAEAERKAKEDAEALAKAKELLDNPPVVVETVVETVHVTDPKLEEQIKKLKKEKKDLSTQHEEEIKNLQVQIDELKRTVPSNPNLLAQITQLTADNERLTREKEAAEKAREQQILAMRQKASETRGQNVQMNLVKDRRPSLLDRIKISIKEYLKKRRIDKATTVTKVGYENAIIHRAKIAVPKMLDDMEKMHEQLSILESLLEKYTKTIDTKNR